MDKISKNQSKIGGKIANQSQINNGGMKNMLTKTRVFTELDTKLKVAIVATGLIPVGFLTYIGMMASSIGGQANAVASIDIGSSRSAFFYDVAQQTGTTTLQYSTAELVTDPALAHSGSQSLLYEMTSTKFLTKDYFNYIGVAINTGDTLEFYIRSASTTFDTKGLTNGIYVKLSYSYDASSTSQMIDITPQLTDGLLTTEYQKISIPREEIAGGFTGKMRHLIIGVPAELLSEHPKFIVDDITVKRRVVETVLESSSTKSVVLSAAAYHVATSTAEITWPLLTDSEGYKIYLSTSSKGLLDANKRQLLSILPNASTSYLISGLATNTTYYIRVEAQNAANAYQIQFRTTKK